MERNWEQELDALRADLALMQRQLTDAKETCDAAFLQATTAAAHVANLMQRIQNLRVADGRIVG
jgi:hypothetical protein